MRELEELNTAVDSREPAVGLAAIAALRRLVEDLEQEASCQAPRPMRPVPFAHLVAYLQRELNNLITAMTVLTPTPVGGPVR